MSEQLSYNPERGIKDIDLATLQEIPAIVRMDIKEKLLEEISDRERIVHMISSLEPMLEEERYPKDKVLAEMYPPVV